MKKNYGIYFFAGGLLLVTIQLLIFVFGYLNSDPYSVEQIIYVAQESSLGDFLSEYWAGIIGTVLLLVLFVRRLSKGPEAMMVLVGALLWVIQLLSLHSAEQPLGGFIAQYFVGIAGIVGVAVAGFFDAYLIKSAAPLENDDTYNN
ncbi:MAG: hypothetical protein IJA62_04160 [Ruminococcus sp.]|nr:hypothetical protein [Ruminococcus sp.]